jgi:hypothetical protein
MPDILVDVYKSIPAEMGAVYRCLTDFREAQPRLLPNSFRDYAVVSGGIGEGTIVTCTTTFRGRDRRFSFRISEPIPTKAITGYDHDSLLTVTWHLRPEGPTTEVEIEAYWTEPDQRFGFLVKWWAYFAVRPILEHMLKQIPLVIKDLELDRPTTPAIP